MEKLEVTPFSESKIEERYRSFKHLNHEWGYYKTEVVIKDNILCVFRLKQEFVEASSHIFGSLNHYDSDSYIPVEAEVFIYFEIEFTDLNIPSIIRLKQQILIRILKNKIQIGINRNVNFDLIIETESENEILNLILKIKFFENSIIFKPNFLALYIDDLCDIIKESFLKPILILEDNDIISYIENLKKSELYNEELEDCYFDEIDDENSMHEVWDLMQDMEIENDEYEEVQNQLFQKLNEKSILESNLDYYHNLIERKKEFE